MIHELYWPDHARVRLLFQPLAEYLPFCAAVLQGRQSGWRSTSNLTAREPRIYGTTLRALMISVRGNLSVTRYSLEWGSNFCT